MGWVGRPMWKCPKGKQRMAYAIEQEVDIDRVVDSALVGTTVYLALRCKRIGHEDSIIGVVILTEFGQHEFCTNAQSEDMGPFKYDCPKRILDKLTPTDNSSAVIWRENCYKRLENKKTKRNEKAEQREHI